MQKRLALPLIALAVLLAAVFVLFMPSQSMYLAPALAWVVNPSGRKRRKGRHHRSAAQRAATARMLAANRGGHRHRKGRRRYRHNPGLAGILGGLRHHRAAYGANVSSAFAMLRSAGVGGAGAVVVDISMGYLGRMWTAAAQPVDGAGKTNWLYFAAKTGVAVGLGTFGRRLLPPSVAARMGEGALTVLAYQILRGLVPAGIALGYLNPAPTARPLAGSGAGGQSLARYLQGSAAGGQSLGFYNDPGEAAAARAANIVAMARRR